MNKSQRLQALLGRGYFPEELPPPFVTEPFAKFRNAVSINWGAITNKPAAKLEIYSYPRVRHHRRNLAVVNPISQFYVSKLISDNWTKIRAHLKKSRYAIETPDIKADGDRAIPRPDFRLIGYRRLRISSNFDHVLLSDISRFYGTLYTHAIPWGLHDKKWCKINLHKPVFNSSVGNQLDVAVRKGQENQTIGLPVGPDTSRVISEIVAVGIDLRLQQKLNLDSEKAFRNVDDWYIGFDGAGEAEDAIAHIASACSEFELELNAEKTQTLSSGASFEMYWPAELRDWRLPSGSHQGASLELYFAKAFSYASEYSDQNVLDYALKRARSFAVQPNVWSLFETCILKAARANATVLPTCAQILISYNASGFVLNKERSKKLIDDVIARHAPIGHHGEVSWALFLAKGLGIEISKKSAQLVSRLESSACALIALDLYHRGLAPYGLDFSVWKQYLTKDGLYSNMWLLAYEADIKGWLVGATPDYVAADPHFGYLKSKGIYFYDSKKNVKHVKKAKAILPPTRFVTYFSLFEL